MGDSQIRHSNFVHQLLLEINQIPNVRAWKQQVGVARSMDDDRVISFGLKGSGDITGIMRCKSGSGLRLEVDAKVGLDKLRVDQRNFSLMITALGGLYIEARNLNETIDQIRNFMKDH